MSLFCPLCCQKTEINDCDSQIIDVIYKYLRIEIKEEFIDNLCRKCQETLTMFDEYAEKCWAAQKIIEYADQDIQFVKKEDNTHYEVEVENSPDNEDTFQNDTNTDPEKKKKPTTRKKRITRSTTKQAKVEEDKYIEIKLENPSDDYINDNCDELMNSNSSFLDNEIDDKSKSSEKNSKRKSFREKYEKDIEAALIKLQCHICDFKARFWHSLANHCVKNHSEKPRVLCICGEFLYDSRTMRNHARSHEETKKIACEQCNKKFRDNSALHLHKASHVPKEECKLHCSLCPKKFPTSVHLILHMKRHQREKESCDICGKILASRSSLKMHKLAVHENIRDHTCDICGYSCFSRSSLLEHKLKHTSVKNFKCKKCDESFKSKRNLSQHDKASHSDLVFQCPECPAVLKNSRCFRQHKLVHVDVYKYACSLCGKQFKRGDTFKGHMKSHKPHEYSDKPSLEPNEPT